MRIFSIFIVAFLFMVNSVFAQGPPNDVETAAKGAAMTAGTNCGNAAGYAGGARTQALTIQANVKPAYSGWTQAQQDNYNASVAAANSLFNRGETYTSMGNSDSSTGTKNEAIADGYWSEGDYADSVDYYYDAMAYWNLGISDFGTAQNYYQQAQAAYQAIINFYNNNIPII